MAIRMQQRRATAEQWTLSNPVLGPGEIGFETDTNKFKIGDGINNWGSLSYFIDETNLTGSLENYVPLTDVGAPNGVAALDVNGQVPASQLANATVDLSGYATETYVDTAVSNLVDSAPTTLDTLNELAAALGDDSNFASTVTTSIANKQDKVISTAVNSNITASAGKYFVDTSTTKTITLVASPALGDEIQIFDATGTAGTNNITVLNNGNKINGILDSAVLDANGVAAVFVWTGSTYGWRMG